MKKISTLFFLMVFGLISINAQKLLSTEVEKRNVVLEEFTGIRCTWCPDGHRIAEAMIEADPNNVVVINIHSGGFAAPGPGEPDFRTTFGTAINGEVGSNSYPNGSVNRTPFNGTLALNRGAWSAAGEEIKTLTSPVNLGVKSSFDDSTRELTVDVELYYTSDSPQNSNFIQVAFLENGFIGFQIDGGVNVPDYEHNKIFRHLLTGQWGDEVTNTSEGSSVTRTYTWTVPTEYDIDKCDIVGYVTESRREVYTGHKVKANGGETKVAGYLASNSNEKYFGGQNGVTQTESFTVENYFDSDEIFEISLIKDTPSDWNAKLEIDGQEYAIGTSITMSGNEIKTINVNTTPGANAGIGNYSLKVISQTLPDVGAYSSSFSIISGVKDLIVSNSEALEYDEFYTDGLEFAGNEVNAKTNSTDFVGFREANALDGVLNIYYNIGWTFPGLTDRVVNALKPFMDNGGNLFIAGQDLGWDAFENGNTANVQSFYNDYLNADFLNDGSSATTSVMANTDDEYFGEVGSSSIIDIYGGGNIYPEQIAPLNGALPIFMYNGNQTGGLRSDNGVSKVVYLGFNFEQLGDNSVARNIAKVSHDWFYEGVSNTFDVELAKQITVYPNPANNLVNVSFKLSESSNISVSIFDNLGEAVSVEQFGILKGDNTLPISVVNLAAGIYHLRINTGNSFATKKISVTK